MRSYSVALLGAALILALPLAAQTAAPAPSGQTNAQPHHVLPKPTNLQVLPKDIPPQDLITLMRGYSKALGVECGFCHETDPKTNRFNFPSDAKPDKTIARTMIAMTQEINTKYLSTVEDPDATAADKTVTCSTCHRGSSMPAPFGTADGSDHHSMPPKSE